MDSIFRDSVTTYSGGYDLYLFDSVNSVLGSKITDFTETPSDISTTLLYFNESFVSGGYKNSSNDVRPFSDWSSGYAVNGPDYSIYANTGSVGGGGSGSTLFKWIVLDVDSKKSGSNLDLSKFLIDGQTHSSKTFGTDYEAYILQDGGFGALNNNGTTNTPWFSDPEYNSNIVRAKNRPASPEGGALQFDVDSGGTIGVDGYINSSGGTVYLIVGLPYDSTEKFSFE